MKSNDYLKSFRGFVIERHGCIGHLLYKNKFYTVSEDGVITNFYGKRLSQSNNGRGYKNVMICRDGKPLRVYVHRLVAAVFVKGGREYLDVNHKDFDRSNNHYSNLEWVTRSENINHSVKNMLGKGEKPIIQFTLSWDFIQEWENSQKAASFYSCSKPLIQQAASTKNKKCKTAKGFHWVYKEDFTQELIDNAKKRFL